MASSQYEIRLLHQPIALEYARVELQLGTDRTAEALSHELLHLSIKMGGYPMGEIVPLPAELNRYAPHILGIHSIVCNLVEHELIREAFLALGFDRANFLMPPVPAPDYRDLASRAFASRGYAEGVGFSWWCLEYLRNWISARHWLGIEALNHTEMALRWGSQVHSDMPRATREIRKLIESGRLLEKNKHPRYLNRLLEVMKLPPFTRWVTVQSGRGGMPVVTGSRPSRRC